MKSRLITLGSGLLILLVFSTSIKAQTERGHWTLGAQIGNLTYKDQSGSSSFSASLSPSAGYFVTNGLVVGTGVPISMFTQKSTIASDYTFNYSGTGIGLSPFIRYFLGKHALKPYVGLAYSYSKINFKSHTSDPTGAYDLTGKDTFTTVVPTLGLACFINQNLGFTLGLNYNINHNDQQTLTITPPSSNPSFSGYTSRSLSLGLGFQLFIGK